MAECNYLKGCSFFNMIPENSPLGSVYMRNYCQSNFSTCAIYQVAENLGKQYVPHDLDPTMYDKASAIIKENK